MCVLKTCYHGEFKNGIVSAVARTGVREAVIVAVVVGRNGKNARESALVLSRCKAF